MAMVVIVNYKIDPANIFAGSEYVAGITDIISEGNNVDNIANYDERLFQQQILGKLKYKPSVVVLGSSRIMEVGKEFYKKGKVINCGVSHANIKDLIAIAGVLDSLKLMPDSLLINIDPGLIGAYYSSEWQTLAPYFGYYLKKYASEVKFNQDDISAMRYKKIGSLFSFDYFQSSISFIYKGRNKNFRNVGSSEPMIYGRHADGTVAYSKEYRSPDTSRIAKSAKLTAVMEGLPEIDPFQKELFETFVHTMLKNNVKIKLCMLPFHEAYYNTINANQSNAFEVYDEYFRHFALKNSIELLGSFNPAIVNFKTSDFYDLYHSSKEAISKIIIN